MAEGWIKVHRKIEDSQVFRNAELFQLWVWCLMKASHKRTWVTVNRGVSTTEIEVQPGQFIFGRNAAAKGVVQNPSSTWRRMLKLQKMGNLHMQSDKVCTIVTINNWETYQHCFGDGEQATEQAADKQRTSSGYAADTYKNVKNEKNEKKEESCAEPAVAAPPADVVLTYPTKGKPGHWHLTADRLNDYRTLYPGCQVERECRRALQWLNDNPTRRKSHNGMPAFLTRWLNRSADRAPAASGQPTHSLLGRSIA